MSDVTKSYTDYMTHQQDVVTRAAAAGFLLIGVGAEPKKLSDRQHQLITKSDHSVVTTGSLDVIGAFLTDLERQHA